MKDLYVLKTLFQSKDLRHPNDDVNFCDGLEWVYVKFKSRASSACELPD